MAWRSENLVDSYERKLQACVNVLLSADLSTTGRRDGQSIQKASEELMEAAQKLEQFFLKAQIAYQAKCPDAKKQMEIFEVQQEIKRKNELIAVKVQKLEEWKKELAKLKHKQEVLR